MVCHRDGNRVVFGFSKKAKNNELKQRINEGGVAQKQEEESKRVPKCGTFQCRTPSRVHAFITHVPHCHVLHVPKVKPL